VKCYQLIHEMFRWTLWEQESFLASHQIVLSFRRQLERIHAVVQPIRPDTHISLHHLPQLPRSIPD
jgi:hypothetical protein